MMQFDGIILDMDGVLADSEPLRYSTYVELFKKNFNVNLPITAPPNFVGRTQRFNFESLLKTHNITANVDGLIMTRQKLLVEVTQKAKALDSLIPTLDSLKILNIKMAVVTNSGRRYTQALLTQIGLATGYFDIILTRDDVKQGKPNPEIYLKALRQLETAPSRTIAVEDSPTGVEAAQKAGIKCFGLSTSLPKQELRMSEKIFENWDQIAKEIL